MTLALVGKRYDSAVVAADNRAGLVLLDRERSPVDSEHSSLGTISYQAAQRGVQRCWFGPNDWKSRTERIVCLVYVGHHRGDPTTSLPQLPPVPADVQLVNQDV